MLQSYDDITNMMTRLIRRSHYYYFLYQDSGHEGAHPECKSFSYDLLGKADEVGSRGERCCSCVAKPGWYDANGTPRFAPHHPKLCADIYATEVALILISCQACGEEYRVQMSWSRSSELAQHVKALTIARSYGAQVPAPSDVTAWSLAQSIAKGTVHFGDPPAHDCSGATMNCWDLKVIEFWRRGNDWARVAELEVDLPDMADAERTTGVPHHPCPKCKKLVADHDGFGVLAHVTPMPDACGYCTHPSISDGKCGICELAMVSDHEYLSAGDNPHASGDRPHTGCSLCGRPRKEHMRP